MDRREFLVRTGQLGTLAFGLSSPWSASQIFGQEAKEPRQPATGPLRASAKNPRYFCDAGGRPMLLGWLPHVEQLGRHGPQRPARGV